MLAGVVFEMEGSRTSKLLQAYWNEWLMCDHGYDIGLNLNESNDGITVLDIISGFQFFSFIQVSF